jgi:arginyl-tRNA synthetase
MKEMLKNKIGEAILALAQASGTDLGPGLPPFQIEEPKDPSHGHLAANAAMCLARLFKEKPVVLARKLLEGLSDPEGYIQSAEVAGPGFLNFRLSTKWWAKALRDIRAAGGSYGKKAPSGRKIQVEFVSANPTGPLHVGHGRGAALGDALARILAHLGHQVEREYYVNDAGRQMRVLGESVLFRLSQPEAERAPEGLYQGEYIRDIAESIRDSHPPAFFDRPQELLAKDLSQLAGDMILSGIKEDLREFRVEHDVYFSESSLYRDGLVEKAFEKLRSEGHLYEEGGALWFRSSPLGDDKDRVLVKSNGDQTYFAADIAYHMDKFQRGFHTVIDVWGADHHGYIPRMKAAAAALGRDPESLAVVLVQLVNLVKDGQQISMSTRAGQFVPLKEVLDEVGTDAARFIFLTRSHESALDFDLSLAKAQTRDNPVYYVQYLCARIHSLLAKAGPYLSARADLSLLSESEEMGLIKHLSIFPEALEISASRLEPHLLATWLTEMARLFHQYYGRSRLIEEGEPERTAARLELAAAVLQVTSLGLGLLGVGVPERM